MKSFFAVVPAVLLALAGTGCTGSRNTNLTPRDLPAAPDSSYLFETSFDSHRRGVDPASVKAWVMLDLALYPMQRVPNTDSRFEALVPLPLGRNNIPYRYKFEFAYPGTLNRQFNSTWSQEYRLVLGGRP
jgi:hypothetical protein